MNIKFFIRKHNLKNFIEKTFHPNDKKFKQAIRAFFENECMFDLSDFEIYKIKCKKTWGSSYKVTIVTGKPGLLIGRGGNTINGLKSFLMKRFESPVNINIKDYSIWDGTFDEKSYMNMDDAWADYDEMMTN